MSSTKSDVYPLFKNIDGELNGEPYAVVGGVIMEAVRTRVNGVSVGTRAIHAAGMSLACTASGRRLIAVADLKTDWTPIKGPEADQFEDSIKEKAGF